MSRIHAHNLSLDLLFCAPISSLLDYFISWNSFEGSSFIAIGDQNKITGEWAIVGGTGVFAFAKGTITICRVQDSGSSNIKEICIRALGFTGQATPIEIKVIVTFLFSKCTFYLYICTCCNGTTEIIFIIHYVSPPVCNTNCWWICSPTVRIMNR